MPFMRYRDYHYYHEKRTIDFENNFLEFRFFEAGCIWDMGELSALAHYRLRSHMKGGGVLRISAAATSIYSVRRTLMHTRVQPHWSPCITGFYTLHWIFLSRTPGKVCTFRSSFSSLSYSLSLCLSLAPR